MSWNDFDWKSIGNIVASVAPTIAGALAGPFGPIASIAVTALLRAVGLGDDASPKDLEAALMSGKPELLIQLRSAEQNFVLELKRAQIDLEKVHAGDRDSARQRERDVKDWTPRVLATVIVSGYILVQAFLLTQTIDVSMRDIVMRSLGIIDVALALVLSYYFGSSSGSRDKTNSLVEIAERTTTKQ